MSADITSFREVADRVWVARYPWFDVNVTVIAGRAGAVVVDTYASGAAAREVVAEVRRLTAAPPVVGIVNTHEHFDHTFGNATMLQAFGPLPVHAHEVAAARTRAAGERIKAVYAADTDDPRRDEVLATDIVPADHTFATHAVVDLGDRQIDLVHPGRGHTGGDLVVRISGADAVLAGDLVEQSAPPAIGADAYPLEWPRSLDRILAMLGPATVVVPGHGAVVDRAFVQRQRTELGDVLASIRDLHGRGVPPDAALDSTGWPWPREALTMAVQRAYAHLDSGSAPPTADG